MPIEVRRATPEDVPELGRICYEAVKDISERHSFPTDFGTVEFAQQVVGMMVQREDVYSVGAFDNGAPPARTSSTCGARSPASARCRSM